MRFFERMKSPILIYDESLDGIMHEGEKAITDAIQKSTGFDRCNYDSYTSGSVIIYGSMRKKLWTLEKVAENGGDYLYIDHGYFTNRDFNRHIGSHYRITLNSPTYVYSLLDLPNDRSKEFNIEIRPFENSIHGNLILVLPPSPHTCHKYLINLAEWISETEEKIRQICGDKYEIITKKKNIFKDNKQRELSELLEDARAVVHFNSNVGLEALLKGKNVITLCKDYYLANYTHTDIENILDKPLDVDRQKLVNNLTYNQFTVEEMANGKAWEILDMVYSKLF